MAWQDYESRPQQTAVSAIPADRVTFIKKTYAHLAGAIGAFLLMEMLLFQTSLPGTMLEFAYGGKFNWLMILGGFMVAGWLARGFAAKSNSIGMQYFGLGLYVLAEAVIFVPLIAIAWAITGSSTIFVQAAVLTAALFTALSAVVLLTGKDFSFLRSFLVVGGIVAIGLIICGAAFGFDLGLAFSGGMVLLAAIAILYDTSKIMLHYPSDQYVGASLELFASVALMFWYVLRILLSMRK